MVTWGRVGGVYGDLLIRLAEDKGRGGRGRELNQRFPQIE